MPPKEDEGTRIGLATAGARATYGVIEAYCRTVGSIQPRAPWDDLSQEVRDQYINGCLHLLDCPQASPAEMHRNWVQYMTSLGWAFGLSKSQAFNTNPNLVPWDELPEGKKAKDFLFGIAARARMGIPMPRLVWDE